MPKKLNKSQIARDIVTSTYANTDLETNECRSTSIAAIKKRLKCQDYMAATYHGNAVRDILSVEQKAGTIDTRLEAGKPVWSVVKISSETNPVVTSFYMFASKKAAMAANSALRFDGVFKGIQTVKAEVIAA